MALPTYKEESIDKVSDNNVEGAQQESKSDDLRREKQALMNNEKLLKKIWILEEGETVGDYRYSFVFTKIEGDMIEGRIAIRTNVLDSYVSSSSYETMTKVFVGTISNKQAKCKLGDENNNLGTITFQFYENNRIEAKLDYVTVFDELDQKDTERSYLFRPYMIQDFAGQLDNYQNEWLATNPDSIEEVLYAFIISDSDEVSFTAELDSWGEVKFVSGIVSVGTAFYPVVFITNDKDEVYYKIHLTNGFEIMDIKVEDTNGDGLKDFTITLCFSDDPEAFKPIWVFNQTKDGMFYKDESDDRHVQPVDSIN